MNISHHKNLFLKISLLFFSVFLISIIITPDLLAQTAAYEEIQQDIKKEGQALLTTLMIVISIVCVCGVIFGVIMATIAKKPGGWWVVGGSVALFLVLSFTTALIFGFKQKAEDSINQNLSSYTIPLNDNIDINAHV